MGAVKSSIDLDGKCLVCVYLIRTKGETPVQFTGSGRPKDQWLNDDGGRVVWRSRREWGWKGARTMIKCERRLDAP